MATALPQRIRDAEERIRAAPANANEILDLLMLCESESDHVRLMALQSCRAIFVEWATSHTLMLEPAEEEDGEGSAALLAFRRWVLDQYRRFVAVLRRLVQRGDTPAGLRTPALDSLVQLAGLEARQAGVAAFEAPTGAFVQLVGGLALCSRSQPEVLARLGEAHLVHLDVAFFLLRALQRLAKAQQARRPAQPERLLELLLLVTPLQTDSQPEDAQLLVRPAGKPSAWSAAAAQLLQSKKHRFEFGRTWRALLALPLPDATYHRALRELPGSCLQYVSRPLQFSARWEKNRPGPSVPAATPTRHGQLHRASAAAE